MRYKPGMDLRTAAQRLDVHYQTAYRWVRDGQLAAVKVGAAYEVADEEVARFAAERVRPAPPPRLTQVRSWEVQSARLVAYLEEGDELSARQQVDRLHDGGVDLLTLCSRLLAPALERIGTHWAGGRISVAVEHRASEICARLLAKVAEHPRGRPRGTCVVATAPGEAHGLPGAMAAAVLRAARWHVHHLGIEVPPDDLAALAHQLAADFVVLAVVHDGARTPTDGVTASLRDEGFTVLVGEPGGSLADLLHEAKAAARQRARLAGDVVAKPAAEPPTA